MGSRTNSLRTKARQGVWVQLRTKARQGVQGSRGKARSPEVKDQARQGLNLQAPRQGSRTIGEMYYLSGGGG